MFGKQKTRKTRMSVTSKMLPTSTSSNGAWKSTVSTITWQTMVDCSMHGLQQPGKRDPRSCCNESLEQRPKSSLWAALKTVVFCDKISCPWVRVHRVPLQRGRQRGVPPKISYFAAIGSFGLKTVADRYKHAAFCNKHWWQALQIYQHRWS